MAKKTVFSVVDDISGDTLPAQQGQTVRFGLDGQDYEIDLSAEHATAFRDAVRRYVHAGRRVGRAQPRATRGRETPRPRRGTAAIRDWARTHGYQVSDRGRIPSSVLEAYTGRG